MSLRYSYNGDEDRDEVLDAFNMGRRLGELIARRSQLHQQLTELSPNASSPSLLFRITETTREIDHIERKAKEFLMSSKEKIIHRMKA